VARLAPPLALGMLLYELGKGYLTLIADSNKQARVQSVRYDFANGYANAVAELVDQSANGEAGGGGGGGEWAGPVTEALHKAEQGQFPDHGQMKECGRMAVMNDWGSMDKAGLAEKIAKAAGYDPKAPRATKEAAIWNKLRLQAKEGDGPIGLKL
jgi:hypothetical protein